MNDAPITITLTQQRDYQFLVDFGAPVSRLLADEPPPLGQAAGPSPVQLLCAAVGNCLSDSLLFALRKFKQNPEPIHCTVSADVGRNAGQRLRVLGMQATLQLGVPSTQLEHLDRVLDSFETYCTVTQSVGQGFPIAVQVLDGEGSVLKPASAL
ncbi:MAG: OsmC family protein [Burkholderiaceae bacterium]|nr:OsmC family protein [Burkholderiaceae bacterium]